MCILEFHAKGKNYIVIFRYQMRFFRARNIFIGNCRVGHNLFAGAAVQVSHVDVDCV